jgi:hypothetical protein
VILLQVDRLPFGATAKPVRLWWSKPQATDAETDLLWQAFLRQFDIEHTFRMLKQTLGWTSQNSATLMPSTAGPGSFWPPTPNYASPAAPSPTYAAPGNALPDPSGPRPPASGKGFGTYTAKPPTPPPRRNPPAQDPADHPGDPTAIPPRRPHRHRIGQRKPETRHQENDDLKEPTTTPHRLNLKLDGRARPPAPRA